MASTLLAIVDPGDEVVVLEPFYENYGPDTAICGAKPVFVPLRAPDYTFDRDELRAAFTPRTKAIIVNTPNNPSGRVFTRDELELIAAIVNATAPGFVQARATGRFQPSTAAAPAQPAAAPAAPPAQTTDDILGDLLAQCAAAGTPTAFIVGLDLEAGIAARRSRERLRRGGRHRPAHRHLGFALRRERGRSLQRDLSSVPGGPHRERAHGPRAGAAGPRLERGHAHRTSGRWWPLRDRSDRRRR